jgi:hypothetical protein
MGNKNSSPDNLDIDIKNAIQDSKLSPSTLLKITKEALLTESFIEDNIDDIDLEAVCTYQYLSEEFIDKYANRLNWSLVLKYQKVSYFLINKHRNKIPHTDYNRYIQDNNNAIEELLRYGIVVE